MLGTPSRTHGLFHYTFFQKQKRALSGTLSRDRLAHFEDLLVLPEKKAPTGNAEPNILAYCQEMFFVAFFFRRFENARNSEPNTLAVFEQSIFSEEACKER